VFCGEVGRCAVAASEQGKQTHGTSMRRLGPLRWSHRWALLSAQVVGFNKIGEISEAVLCCAATCELSRLVITSKAFVSLISKLLNRAVRLSHIEGPCMSVVCCRYVRLPTNLLS